MNAEQAIIRLEDKVVIITGGTMGIGEGCAYQASA